MPQDDFLKQFQQSPPDDFSNALLQDLKNMEQNLVATPSDNTESNVSSSSKQPITLVPVPRNRYRVVDRYLTLIASVVVMILFSSVMIVSIGNQSDDSQSSGAFALPIATDALAQLLWSTDGDRLFVADATQLYILDQRLQLLSTLPLDLTGSVHTLNYLADTEQLIIGDHSGTLTIISLTTLEITDTLYLHDDAVQAVAWSHRHDVLLSASRTGDLVILQQRSQRFIERDRIMVSQESIPMFVSGISVHPNGHDVIVTMNNSATYVYALEQNGSINTRRNDIAFDSMPPTLHTTYSQNGLQIYYIWWDQIVTLESQLLNERKRTTLPYRFQWLSPIQVSERGSRVLLSNNRNHVGVWDFSRDAYIPILDLMPTSDYEVHAALHPNGRLVAGILPSGEIHLWQISALPDESFDVVEVAVNRPGVNRQLDADLSATLEPLNPENNDDLIQLFNFGDGFLTQALWTPDGSQLLVTSTSTIRVYDRDLTLLREWALVGTDAIKSAFSADGRFLLTASSTGTISIWDAFSGRMIASLSNVHDSRVQFLEFLGNRNRIITRDESGEFILIGFDGSSLRQIDQFFSGALAPYQILDWHLEEDLLRFVMMRDLSSSQNTSDLVNIVDFNLAESFEAHTTTTAISGTFSTFSHDASQLLVYNINSDNITFYDSRSFVEQSRTALPDGLGAAVHMHRDRYTDHIVLVDYDNELYRYDLMRDDVHQITNVNALLDNPRDSVTLHPNGTHMAIIASHNHILSGIIEQDDATYVFSELGTDTPVLGQIRTFITGSQNVAAASTSDGAVLLFDIVTGRLLRRIDLVTWGIRNHDIAFDPTGRILIVTGQPVMGINSIVNIIDVEAAISGEDAFHVGDSPYQFAQEYISGLTFNQDGDQLITGGSQVRLWSISSDTVRFENISDLSGLLVFAHHPTTSDVATLRPGNYLRVFSTNDMQYRYSNRLTNQMSISQIFLSYFASGDYILVAVSGHAIEIFDAESGDLLMTLDGFPGNEFDDMVISPDGQYLYVAGRSGIAAWNLEKIADGQTAATALNVDFAIEQIAISPDSTRLFLVSADGTIHVYGVLEN